MQRALNLPGKTKPYLMAHRGNRVTCPENTLASFHQAIQDGADILETDLHLTSDNVMVCIHDATVDRTTDGKGAVAEMTLKQLKSLSASYGRNEFREEKILTLTELASIIPEDKAIALELKSDRFLEPGVCRKLAQELRKQDIFARTVILSFSTARLQAVQAVEPELPIGWITVKRIIPIKGVQLIGPLFPILYLNPLYVAWAHRLGQFVCPLDTTPDARLGFYRWLGCDAVLSDDPGKTRKVLYGKK